MNGRMLWVWGGSDSGVNPSPLSVANRVVGRTGSLSRMVLRIASTQEGINSLTLNSVRPASSS
jgi:hypothetical protein